ncbi:MAG TPA: zf-TFIIB domain-containing protein [Planctomycetota bacterium]|nr:zf-TFIIB domain-containing protein [Planctomycetota bacterium]
MPLGVLSDRSDQNLVPRLWAAADAYPRPGIACAFCWQPSLSLVAHEVELDLCRSCRSLWFDAHELERLPIRGALNQQPSIGRTDADSKVGFFAGDVADEVFRSGDKMDLVGDAAEISSVVGETINALSALIGDWG